MNLDGEKFKYNVYPPLIFRYMDAKYVEAFFNDGSLRISSFAKFGKHVDEQRLDLNEGKLKFMTRSKEDGGQTIIAEMVMGQDAYVLCTTAIHTHELMTAFDSDSYIRINNSHHFGMEIAKVIPGVKRAFECFCFYHSSKLWLDDDRFFDYKSTKKADGTYAMEPLLKFSKQTVGIKPFLIKNKEYAHQCEYRFVWIIDKESEEHIDIKVPEAIKYCSRPSELDL
jgi:hypothetical protein